MPLFLRYLYAYFSLTFSVSKLKKIAIFSAVAKVESVHKRNKSMHFRKNFSQRSILCWTQFTHVVRKSVAMTSKGSIYFLAVTGGSKIC